MACSIMSTLSIDLRERILVAYDAEDSTREEIAKRFMVSLGMVKKLIQQRKATGDIAPRHKFSGRKKKITADHRQQLRQMIADQADLTLDQMRVALGVECTLQAVHYALKAMGLSYKKRLSIRPSKIGQT